MNEHIKQLLNTSKNEILQLRRQNELLGVQLDIVHVFAVALGIKQHNMGASVDICWEIDKVLHQEDQDG